MTVPAIETTDLARTYQAKKGRASMPVIALDGVDLQVQPGELFGLLRPGAVMSFPQLSDE